MEVPGMYNYIDYFDTYGRIMQFNKNKLEPIHRWYPFVEGYSKEFIQSIINELKYEPELCLEPFSGSGTTALELQNLGIKCVSFEINPHMFKLAKVKLECDYSFESTVNYLDIIKRVRKSQNLGTPTSVFKTLYENGRNKKWNYNKEVAIAIENLKSAISTINDAKYRDLFTVALSSILLDVSNLYRNGKCLSLKKNWNTRNLSEDFVYDLFDRRLVNVFAEDIKNIEVSGNQPSIKNSELLYLQDSRIGIDEHVADNSVDLVITSPPYLNSRDYTDTYMLELKTMGYTNSLSEIDDLRRNTIHSHVQLKWIPEEFIDNEMVTDLISRLKDASKTKVVWNDSIFDMVNLYFKDMDRIFYLMEKKLKPGGRIYFNVSDSAYFGITVNSIDICASIAEKHGLSIREIRRARKLKTSPQQKADVGSLLEAVIVMEKPNEC
jgi:DNA modification methylase